MRDIDPITFEVLRNALVATVDEMGVMLEKVAFSLSVSEGRDFSTSITDASGDLVADGTQDLPGHVGTLPFTTKGILSEIPRDRLKPGDVILVNDPYLGGTHCQDMRAVMPVFWDGELVSFVQTAAHLLDMGGRVPGSFQVDARSAYEEALYVTPIHLVRDGFIDEEVLRLILRNIRVPEVTRGDLVAMVEACRTGEARLRSLFDRYGAAMMLKEMEQVKRHSRDLLEQHLRELPAGKYSFTDYVDFDPAAEGRQPLRIQLDLSISDGRATYDFSRSSDQALGAVNISRSLLWSGVVVGTKAMFPDVPVTQGVFEALDVVAPDGLVVSAQFPAATSAGFATTFEKVTACVFGCYLQLLPDKAMVGSGNTGCIVLGGIDPRTDPPKEFVMVDWTAGGYGARPGKRDNHSAISLYASGTQNQPIELLEREHPVLFHAYGLMPDSAGPGKHRGGLGIYRSFELTHGATGVISVTGDREVVPAWGYAGGEPARGGEGMVFTTKSGEQVNIGTKRSGVPVETDWRLTYGEGGGGGYGEPWLRPPEWVLEDVLNGYVSVESAVRDYCVAIEVVDEESLEYLIDEEETARLRAAAAERASRDLAVAQQVAEPTR